MEDKNIFGILKHKNDTYEVIFDGKSFPRCISLYDVDTKKRIGVLTFEAVSKLNNIAIEYFYIDEKYRGNGLGTKLLNYFLDNLGEFAGFPRAENIFIHLHNNDAETRAKLYEFYKCFWFKPTRSRAYEYALESKEYDGYDLSYEEAVQESRIERTKKDIVKIERKDANEKERTSRDEAKIDLNTKGVPYNER